MDTIGFDVGGSFVKGGRLSSTGEVLAEERWPTPGPPSELVDLLASQVRRWGDGAPVGIACAGIVDPFEGVVRRSPNLPQWREVPLAALFRAASASSTTVLNDANAFLLAEVALGCAVGARSAVGLTIGTGVGGAIFLDGRLWQGSHGFAGEPGHITIDMDGPRCACGANGCLEALVGTQAILARYREFAEGDCSAASPEELSLRARQGDAAAIRTFAEVGGHLGLGLMSLVHLLDPEVIVIGGGIAAAGDLFLGEARRVLAGSPLIPEECLPPVRLARLGNAAGWIGAALAVRRGDAGA